jgi:hypothetical protein
VPAASCHAKTRRFLALFRLFSTSFAGATFRWNYMIRKQQSKTCQPNSRMAAGISLAEMLRKPFAPP